MADTVGVKAHTRKKSTKKGKKEHPATFDSSKHKQGITKREPITRGVEIIGGGDKRQAGEPRKGVTILGRNS